MGRSPSFGRGRSSGGTPRDRPRGPLMGDDDSSLRTIQGSGESRRIERTRPSGGALDPPRRGGRDGHAPYDRRHGLATLAGASEFGRLLPAVSHSGPVITSRTSHPTW